MKKSKFSTILVGIGATVLIIRKKRKHKDTRSTLFKIEEIEQEKNEITLKWSGKNALYKIYRDDIHIYSGEATSFTDTGLTAGTSYIYTIEKHTSHPQNTETIKIQTTTAVKDKNFENILSDLIVTTIISPAQIQMQWEPIDGVKEYKIYRNHKKIAVVEDPYFMDQIAEAHQAYTYMIKAKRLLAFSEKKMSSGKFAISGMMGLFKKDTSQKDATMETFRITKEISPINRIQRIKVPKKQTKEWQILYMTFLDKKWVKNPNFLSSLRYFKGDHRQFNPDSTRYRTKVEVLINSENVKLIKNIGETKAYGLTRKFKKADKASDAGIELADIVFSGHTVSFILKHSVGNPLVVSPAMNYELRAIFSKNGFYDISGTHDQSPYHEIYIKNNNHNEWQPVHLMESKGLDHMTKTTPDTFWRVSNFNL